MNKTLLLLSVVFVACLIFVPGVGGNDGDFEKYREAIKKEHGIDIKDFKEKLKGGRADGKKLVKYKLDQLLMGIKVELEHTTDAMTALEISTDHLEEFPDYYTRLLKMEKEAEEDEKAEHKDKK